MVFGLGRGTPLLSQIKCPFSLFWNSSAVDPLKVCNALGAGVQILYCQDWLVT